MPYDGGNWTLCNSCTPYAAYGTAPGSQAVIQEGDCQGIVSTSLHGSYLDHQEGGKGDMH